MNNQKLKVAAQKTFVFLSGIGATVIVGKLIKQNVTPTSTIQKVVIPLGAFALGGVAANAAVQQATRDAKDIEVIVTEVQQFIVNSNK